VVAPGESAKITLRVVDEDKSNNIEVTDEFGNTASIDPAFNPLDSQFFYDRQLRLIACGMASEREIERGCELLLERILAGALPARRLIGCAHPWQELPAVYEALAQRREGELTRILQWRQG